MCDRFFPGRYLRQGSVFSFSQALSNLPTSAQADTARIPSTGKMLAKLGSVFCGCLIARRLPSGWESASLRTMASANKPQFGVHLAADYGPKRSNSDRLAGSCLTIFAAREAIA